MHIKTSIKINFHIGMENIEYWVIYSLVFSVRKLTLLGKRISKENFKGKSKGLFEEL